MTQIKYAKLHASSLAHMNANDLCVARVPIFGGLTREEQLHVAEFVHPMQVTRGDIVWSPGQAMSRLLVMHSGQLKISHITPSGQEQILRIVTEGDVVGERSFLTGHRPVDLVTALEDSRMCVLDHADLAALIRTYPDITTRMLQTLSDRLYSVERVLAAVTSSDVNARVAAYLLDLPGIMQNGVTSVTLPMAKQDVAAYLGTTPETLSRRLAAFAAAGIIELRGRRDVTILDIDALEEQATPH